MATIYKVEMKIVSEFCSYNEEQLTEILRTMIKKYRNKDNGLGLLVDNIKVERKA